MHYTFQPLEMQQLIVPGDKSWARMGEGEGKTKKKKSHLLNDHHVHLVPWSSLQLWKVVDIYHGVILQLRK